MEFSPEKERQTNCRQSRIGYREVRSRQLCAYPGDLGGVQRMWVLFVPFLFQGAEVLAILLSVIAHVIFPLFSDSVWLSLF